MRSKKRTTQPEKSSELTDLEVARKMIKIFQSAQDRKLHFDLSFKTVKTLLTYPSCYYTGKRFEEDGQYARSFDRIDSDKGYVEGNVVACTIDINSKKSNLTFEEIELLYNKLSGFKKEQEHETATKADETRSFDRVDVMIDDEIIMIEANSLRALRLVKNRFIEAGYILQRDVEQEKMFRKDKVTKYMRIFYIVDQITGICFN